ncbi:hypothetical protein CO172_02450 [Candidatus Uhrbacteria bacterium CG_4_9_14_3_um_filter_36_7]|uniref:SAM-dependent MTase RsmB/NOP-type domain-containing protein n=1 Tax=Candidatus Uhrbacteria bacterium CG_4_9_14_3_um_filter_36_7 TaxID=1975033 RepID=A0A2M7XHB9_9BACT|nr:MAG: hypothetical protein CO172_02450 [Candidatus Uhrbacteria bacterium CG_4_9_14_3_um_filter_36_7]
MKTDLSIKLISRLEQQFGRRNFLQILKAFETKRLSSFRVNTLKTTDEQVMDILGQDHILFERIKQIPHAFIIRNKNDCGLLNHDLVKNGWVYLQGISSMIPVILLDPKPAEMILDLCAAPGSKTSQIAALMENQGKIVACENNPVRFQKLQYTIQKQGVKIADIYELDSTVLPDSMNELFDRVLVDAPCSAEGRIYLQEPRTYKFWSQKNILKHTKLQRRLLRSGFQALKIGGTLVYSTCTLSYEENEQMVEWVLKTYSSVRPVSCSFSINSTWLAKPAGFYLLPNQSFEGFFVVKFLKTASL